MTFEIYCDGSTRGNGKEDAIGGYGFIVVNSSNNAIIERFVERELNTTNQRCELLAIISACKYIEDNHLKNFVIYTDSSYCYNAWKDKWYVRWEKNNRWLTSKGEPVKNSDLWKQLLPYYKKEEFIFEKVKGHSTNYYNNFIDSLVATISRKDINFLQGQSFGELKCIRLWGNKFTDGVVNLLWLCECSCGNKISVNSTNLLNGQKSCGCVKPNHSYDQSNQQFGFLKPLKKAGTTKDKYALWECQCLNCGGITFVSSRTLKEQISCGCIKSKGESKISELLTKLNVNYKKEVKFEDLKDEDYLRFDFGIYNEQNQLLALIEYQGRQHFHSDNSGWNTKEHLQSTQKHDEMKREYCKAKQINFIEIPYLDFDKLNEDYIQEVVNNVGSCN